MVAYPSFGKGTQEWYETGKRGGKVSCHMMQSKKWLEYKRMRKNDRSAMTGGPGHGGDDGVKGGRVSREEMGGKVREGRL